MLDDGLETDAWIELIEWRAAFDELVTFFYNSFAAMTRHAGEFFHHQHGLYNTCEARTITNRFCTTICVEDLPEPFLFLVSLLQALLQHSQRK